MARVAASLTAARSASPSRPEPPLHPPGQERATERVAAAHGVHDVDPRDRELELRSRPRPARPHGPRRSAGRRAAPRREQVACRLDRGPSGPCTPGRRRSPSRCRRDRGRVVRRARYASRSAMIVGPAVRIDHEQCRRRRARSTPPARRCRHRLEDQAKRADVERASGPCHGARRGRRRVVETGRGRSRRVEAVGGGRRRRRVRRPPASSAPRWGGERQVHAVRHRARSRSMAEPIRGEPADEPDVATEPADRPGRVVRATAGDRREPADPASGSRR